MADGSLASPPQWDERAMPSISAATRCCPTLASSAAPDRLLASVAQHVQLRMTVTAKMNASNSPADPLTVGWAGCTAYLSGNQVLFNTGFITCTWKSFGNCSTIARAAEDDSDSKDCCQFQYWQILRQLCAGAMPSTLAAVRCSCHVCLASAWTNCWQICRTA